MRKQIFKNLDDRLDDTNYDDLPAQEDETYVYVSRDKKILKPGKQIKLLQVECPAEMLLETGLVRHLLQGMQKRQ